MPRDICHREVLGQRKEQAYSSLLSISLKSRNINETLLNSSWNRDVDSSPGFLSFGLTNCMLSLAFLCPDSTTSGVNHFHGTLWNHRMDEADILKLEADPVPS